MTLSQAIASHAHGADPSLLTRRTAELQEIWLAPLRHALNANLTKADA